MAPPEAPNNGYMFGKGVRAPSFILTMDGSVGITADDLLLASCRSTLLTLCPSQPITAGRHPKIRRYADVVCFIRVANG